jgi:uncharacterized protein YecE (DUF72 family)
MQLYVGTSGYNFPEWRGSFYPAKFPAAKMLAYYAERLQTVEVNYTFYRMPTPKNVAQWAASVPETFRFVLKGPQRITHFSRLKDIDENLRFFCETALGLGPRLGALLFQLPPNFKKDVSRLGNLLAQLPPGARCACEFRHASWFDDEVYEMLRTYNAALCVADTDENTTPLVATADFGYVRLRDEGYDTGQVGEWVRKVRELGANWRDAFIFFKHEGSAEGPRLAQQFLELSASSPSASSASPPSPSQP